MPISEFLTQNDFLSFMFIFPYNNELRARLRAIVRARLRVFSTLKRVPNRGVMAGKYRPDKFISRGGNIMKGGTLISDKMCLLRVFQR